MLNELVNILNNKNKEIEEWFALKQNNLAKCFYSSVDLRYSGSKLVPVDTNLFPAGFNNLNSSDIFAAQKLCQSYLKENFFKVNKILLIGEDHTRNLHYFDNLQVLANIMTEAGYEVKISAISANEKTIYQGVISKEVTIYPIAQENNILLIKEIGFQPDLIILNNDLMSGIPDMLQNIVQNIIPDPNNGWFRRRKSNHFSIYNNLLKELEQKFGISYFALSTDFDVCEGIDFKQSIGLEQLECKSKKLLAKLANEYKANNINDQPYLVIKSDHGTYGMGIMMINSASEITAINKKLRKQMNVTKNNIQNQEVIIQEGVMTIDKIGDKFAEPLIYLIDHQEVAFLYRTHSDKDQFSNLNSVGMEIINSSVDANAYKQCCSFVARLATLAAAMELGS